MDPHKQTLQTYFDGPGFARWQAIYGEGELSRVRATIRAGHERMLATAAAWLGEHRTGTMLDAGCGTGLFAVAMAERGWQVTAVDIAPQMAGATAARAEAAGMAERVTALAGDLEAATGEHDAAVCFDVLIHYDAAALGPMLSGLAARSRGPVLFTYAPHTPVLGALAWLGDKFPKGERRTDVKLIRRTMLDAALAGAGLREVQRASVRSGFYYVELVETARIDD